MKTLSIAMAVSVLMLVSAPSLANPNSTVVKIQKPMEVSKVEVIQPKVMRLSFDNKDRKLSEKDIYKQIVSTAKRSGIDLKDIEAQKVAHIVKSALDDTPPGAASLKITITIRIRGIEIIITIEL